MKFKAPEGVSGISVGGEQFDVDDKGEIETPDTGTYYQMLAPHGFTPADAATEPAATGEGDKPETAAEKRARLKAEKAAATEPAATEAQPE